MKQTVKVVLASTAAGFWFAVVEILAYLPGAFIGQDVELKSDKLKNILADPLTISFIRDDLVAFTTIGFAAGAMAALGYLPWARDRERASAAAPAMAVTLLLFVPALFYLPAFVLPPAGVLIWTTFKFVTYPVAAIVLFYAQYRYCRGRTNDELIALPLLQGWWLIVCLVFVKLIKNDLGSAGTLAQALLAAAVIALAGVGFWLTKTPAVRVWPRVRRGPAVAAAAITVVLIAYVFYFAARGYRRLPAGAGPGHGPNLVMVVLDTVRADRLSCYGHSRPTTPFIDKVAAEGLRFTRAYTPSPWTLPSHASFFTGLHPSEHQTVNGSWWLDHRYLTLAERLQANGYTTLGFSCNPWLSKHSNMDQGFDLMLGPRRLFTNKSSLAAEDLWRSWLFYLNPADYVLDNGAEQANATAIGWLSALAKKPRPFFLFVNYMEAHPPYPNHPTTHHFFPDPEAAADRIKEFNFNWLNYESGLRTLSAPELEMMRTRYDGCLYYLDRRVEELARGLKEAGHDSNTVVVILSDHGELLGEQGLWSHGFTMNHSLLSVPLIVWKPGTIPAGGLVDAPFSLIHLPETILDLMAGRQPPILTPNHQGDKYLFAERFRPRNLISLLKKINPEFNADRFDHDQKSVIAHPRHLIWDAKGDNRMFDVVRDPEEINDLVKSEPETFRELFSIITDFRQKHPDPVLADGKKRELDEETLRKLRALGYIDDGRLDD